MQLREMTWIQPSYISPRQNFVKEALIPCLEVADSYRCMAGFFDSNALRQIAPGLAEYIGRPDQPVRLIVNPYIDKADQEAIEQGLTTEAEVLKRRLLELCGAESIGESALARYTLICLAYLIASGRLEMKVSLVYNGLFHPKVWLFGQGADTIAIHGSANYTEPGLIRNVEQVMVSRSWRDDDQATIVENLSDEFEALWHNGRPEYAKVIDLPRAVRDNLLRRRPDHQPTPEEFDEAWKQDDARGLLAGTAVDGLSPFATNPPATIFEIPAGLNYYSGDFAHQGKAVEAWLRAGRRGILEMATGSGKTVTALVAAHRVYAAEKKLLIVVAAPYVPLIEQWADESRHFGLLPVIPGNSSKQLKLAEVEAVGRRLAVGASTVEILVVTHDFLCEAEFQSRLQRITAPMMLIADEVHNLGRPAFIANQPNVVQARMGLSATPERQYDEFGTAVLREFFGEIVFGFPLEQAIGKCLVPYDYYVHPLEMNADEAARWADLTNRLRKLGWTGDEQGSLDQRAQRLLIKRRAILERAAEKVDILEALLRARDVRSVRHTLIYASDKGRDQLQAVNVLLGDLRLRFYQLTFEETQSPRVAAAILSEFAAGGLQVLSAMRVLDEGVNIPQVREAYILASTTVERQWVQRRGRVLRMSPGKSKATIHDFLVLPPDSSDASSRNLLRSELARASAFARLASNAAAADGALVVTQNIIRRYLVRGA